MSKQESKQQHDEPTRREESAGSPEDEHTARPAETESTGEAPETGGSLEERLEGALAERDALHDRWIRTQAELENYRKRTQKEAQQNRRYQALPLARDLLPALDNLQRAIEAAETSRQIDELLEGIRMVSRQFDEILSRHAVEPIEAVDQPFDPNFHEAVQHVPSAEQPPMTVVQELERGYRLHDRVVRPSRVIVSSGPPQEKQESSQEEIPAEERREHNTPE